MATKLEQMMADFMAAQNKTNETLFGLIANGASAPTNGTTTPANDTITGVIARIAASNAGAMLVDVNHADGSPRWFNVAPNSGATFENFTAGQNVVLTLEMVQIPESTTKRTGRKIRAHKAERVTRIALADGKAPRPKHRASLPDNAAEQMAASVAAKPAPSIAPVKADTGTCPYCGNGCTTKKYGRDEIRFTCSYRQYQKSVGQDVPLAADSVIAYAQWLAATPVRVFAHNAAGYADIGGQPTPPVTSDDAPKAKRGRPRKASAIVTGALVSASSAPDDENDDDDEIDVPAAENDDDDDEDEIDVPEEAARPIRATEGTFSVLVAKKSGTPSARTVKVISEDFMGHDGSGCWIGPKEDNKNILAYQKAIAGLSVGDRIIVKLKTDFMVGLKMESKATTVTGVTPGVKSAGKDSAPSKAPAASSHQENRAAATKAADKASRRCTGCGKTFAKSSDLFNGQCTVCRNR